MAGSGAVGGAAEGAVQQTSPDAAAPAKRTRWITAVSDRVPAKWIGGIATAAVLASTAAFGGLSAVAVPPLPELAVGETFTGAGLELTVERAILIDKAQESGATTVDDERLLILVIDATNLDDVARQSVYKGSVSELRIEQIGDVAPSVARIDDDTAIPWLQPGVPAQLALTWPIPASAIVDGDDVRVALHTATKHTGKYFVSGDYWDDVVVAAHMTVPVEELDRADAG